MISRIFVSHAPSVIADDAVGIITLWNNHMRTAEACGMRDMLLYPGGVVGRCVGPRVRGYKDIYATRAGGLIGPITKCLHQLSTIAMYPIASPRDISTTINIVEFEVLIAQLLSELATAPDSYMWTVT